ncbi:MAG: NADH:flavin oxidoreductase / oxidase family [Actinomycetota bacterium]|nr:NADH:flavin oxidoreductase / oxidase family [Actinomycetota bacterium]
MFEPLTINGVTFPNRLVRSSIGGRLAFYDGRVNPAWGHFERRFAERHREAFPNAEFISLPDSGHFAPADDPESVARAVIPFLQRVTAS